jgi:aspartyl-tRNA(Asn)/glutamyl-tRNA(Gln) amidotransferase subunit C
MCDQGARSLPYIELEEKLLWLYYGLMTKLSKADVLHVAKLAKLDLTETEVDKYSKQLSSIVDYISELSEVDTENTEPTSQTTGLENVYREDLVKSDNTLTQDQATSGSDKTHNGYFKVPAILSERTDK